MDCKVASDEGDGTREFRGQLPHVECIGSLYAVLGATGGGQALSAASGCPIGNADYADHQQPDAKCEAEPHHQAIPSPQRFAEPQSEH